MVSTAAEVLDCLRRYRLLEPAQLEELTGKLHGRSVEPRALLQQLIKRGWLTAYQANQLLQGKGAELLLGSYVLLDLLGEGGMGAVFKARHVTLDRTVALKLIRKERLENADAVKRFRREIRAAAQLEHPHIVRAFDADEVDGTHILVMEYVEGTDLARHVKERGPLPVLDACRYVRQAALGLQHAFEKGMVHRDIKPHNLLLTTIASGGLTPPRATVKILDMGLVRVARPQGSEDSSSSLTRDGLVMGTVDYIAPEQAMDSHTVDIRADLYSLGCTLYFLLTGKVPFPGGDALAKLMKHKLDEPIPVERLRPEVPLAVASVVRRLMAKQPDDRFPTPAAAAAALADAEHCRTPALAAIAGADTAEDFNAPRHQAARQRWRRWNIAGGLLLLTLLGLFGLLLTFSKAPSPTTPVAQTIVKQTGLTKNTGLTKDTGKMVASRLGVIELLPLIDPDKDGVNGKWQVKDGELSSDDSAHARIRVPYRPPAEYDLRIVFMRIGATGSVGHVVVGNGRQFRCGIGGYSNTKTFFEMVDGQDGIGNRSTVRKNAWLKNLQRDESRVEVRKHGVKLFLDGALATELKTDFSDLSLPNAESLNEALVLGLGSHVSPTCFYRVAVVEISGPGTFTRPDDPAVKQIDDKLKK